MERRIDGDAAGALGAVAGVELSLAHRTPFAGASGHVQLAGDHTAVAARSIGGAPIQALGAVANAWELAVADAAEQDGLRLPNDFGPLWRHSGAAVLEERCVVSHPSAPKGASSP
jgi:hypothetical protein